MDTEPKQDPLNILLADDDSYDRASFERALLKIGIPTNLITVKDGEELMSYLTENLNSLPDILFLDLSIPRKTGIECLSEIKENPALKGLSVVMFSKSNSSGINFEEGLINSLYKIGAIDFIHKPDNFDDLKELVQNCLIKVSKTSCLRTKLNGDKLNMNSKKLNILLADDDADDRSFFAKALSEIPILTSLATVSDGEQLMAYLAENLNTLPDILFLDLSMPRKTGFECLSEIKENEKLKDLPVIMFSTSYTRGISFEQNLIDTLYKIGAQDYIRKPGDFQQLKEVIHNAIIKMTRSDNETKKIDQKIN